VCSGDQPSRLPPSVLRVELPQGAIDGGRGDYRVVQVHTGEDRLISVHTGEDRVVE
jgi:hypothetical protein